MAQARVCKTLDAGSIPATASKRFRSSEAVSAPSDARSHRERLRKRIGLTHLRLHDFRHFHGTELASAGVPMTVVRDRLRHSNLRTTSMYAHGRRALDRAAADAIGATLRAKSK